jgi:uncharacterized membrane protein (UPF0127 family)
MAAMALAPALAADGARHEPSSSLAVQTGSGEKHPFRVYLAQTSEQRARGLMFVKTLPPDAGMLFIYEQPRMISMWMKNTFIPLDMLFIEQGGRIVHIAENATPHSLESISSTRPALAVLEVNGGTVSRLGILVGDTVLHPALANGEASRSSETN